MLMPTTQPQTQMAPHMTRGGATGAMTMKTVRTQGRMTLGSKATTTKASGAIVRLDDCGLSMLCIDLVAC